MSRTFAVGDIHGCAKTLRKLLEDEINLGKDDIVYFLGDYIDRGPHNKDVIDIIMDLKKNGYNIYTLRGNHEQLFIDSEKDIEAFNIWTMNGGVATLESFDIVRFGELDDVYKNFFNETKFYHETEGFIFVHAGLNFDAQYLLEDTFSMLWIRDMKVDKKRIGNKIIVHGHTPTPLKKVKKNLDLVNEKGSLNIDTGCALKSRPGYGYLTAIDVGSMRLYSVENVD